MEKYVGSEIQYDNVLVEGVIALRIFPWQLLPYLPDAQFRGQLRELVAIMHDWKDKGTTNHLLINRVMQYPKYHLLRYYALYSHEYQIRYSKRIGIDITRQFIDFCFDKDYRFVPAPFDGWHDKAYLRIVMSNLLEKHIGIGKSRITDAEWKRLCEGYKKVTGETYVL